MRSNRELRILFLASNPEATSRLDLEEELRSLENELRGIRFRESVRLTTSHAIRPDDLVRLLRRETPSVVHFSGHGTTGGIILRTDSGHVAVPGDALQRLFRERGVELVVLNACHSESQACALAEVVPTVVGTSAAVGDEAARRFTVAFYRTLGDGFSVKEAFRDGGDAVAIHTLDDVFIAHGDLNRILLPGDTGVEDLDPAPRRYTTTSDLTNAVNRLTRDEKLVFRAVLKFSSAIHKNVYREFFRAANRVGGVTRDGYRFRVIETTGLDRPTVERIVQRLLDDALIQQEALSDILYSPAPSVVTIVNRSPNAILSLLYTQDEIDSPRVEVFHGSTHYKDGKPDYYTDMDDKPLEGAHRLNEYSDVITFFKNGRAVRES